MVTTLNADTENFAKLLIEKKTKNKQYMLDIFLKCTHEQHHKFHRMQQSKMITL